MSSLKEELQKLAKLAGGSFVTVADRTKHLERFADWLSKIANIQVREVAKLKATHIQGYIKFRAESISARTAQNELSAICRALQEAGRGKLANSLKPADMGIAGASRDGTKVGITEERFEELKAKIKDEGIRAALDLQRTMGLRRKEAIMGAASLRRWEKEIKEGRPIEVGLGSKGGRPRLVYMADREKALQAVQKALQIAKERRGKLILGNGLKGALKDYSNACSRAGFTKEEAPHSIRYAFAHDQIRNYVWREFSQKEALSRTSQDLGHGDGRGRWVKQVYAKGLVL